MLRDQLMQGGDPGQPLRKPPPGEHPTRLVFDLNVMVGLSPIVANKQHRAPSLTYLINMPPIVRGHGSNEIETFIETGMRWGEVIALRPRHVDFLSRMVSVEDTIVETSKKNSPTGERFLVKPYPKNNEPRTFGVRQGWLDEVAAHIRTKSIGRDELLFATRVGTPISRNSFRTQVWLPAVKASGVDFRVRVHDLRHAHASWLLAGGSDLRSVMDRMGHHQIQTTQKYLHALPEADRKNLDALERISRGTNR